MVPVLTEYESLIFENDENEFIERSDFIKDSDLELWNVENPFLLGIRKKILGVGAKLLVGPRGTGKTHQMKLAYIHCLKHKDAPLGLYVSFSKYFHLEPYLYKTPNALQIFHTWVLSKVLLSCYEYLRIIESDIDIDEGLITEASLTEFVAQAEKGQSAIKSDELISEVTIHRTISIIETIVFEEGKKRCILMLDDAALTLTPEYMIEFFDIFRSLKTKNISPKASVYPGTTEYGPRFHVGQDAERVDCWLNVEDENFSSFMNELLEKRFGSLITEINKDVIEAFKYASFGVPRAFIGLLRMYNYGFSGYTLQSKFNKIIDFQVDQIKNEYLSLHQKMPQHKSIIEIGYTFFQKIIGELKLENKELTPEKQIVVGIQEFNNSLISRMIKFLIEAGLLYELTSVSHGDNREYNRYIPHLVFLIQNRTFNPGRGFDIKTLVENLSKKSKKHPLRRTINKYLSDDDLSQLKLNLPSCSKCGSVRISEEQKFCHNCGNELVGSSVFEECMQLSVDELPLTEFQKIKVKESNINKVSDFMVLADPATELQKVPKIGKKRSETIIFKIKSTVDEFLV